MKRSGPLPRRTPLVRSAMPPRSTPLRRSAARLGLRRPRKTSAEKDARDVVRERSGGLCEACLDPHLGTDWHHRVRRSQGGRWSAPNGMWLCRRVHDWIGDNPASAAVLGWYLESHQDPAAEPLRRRGDWVVLSEDGLIGYSRPPERAAELLRVATIGAAQ